MTRITVLLAASLALHATTTLAGTLVGTVKVDGQSVANAVVFLESRAGQVPRVASPPVVVDQRNLEFAPKVLPVVAGTTIEFTNNDDIQHNVFSPSETAGKFDLGAYGPGATRSVQLNEPGEVIVLCNIHMEMEARIIVLRDPYFAMTAADGSFRIPAVPPGTYSAKVWHEHFLPDSRVVNVPADGEATVDLTIGK